MRKFFITSSTCYNLGLGSGTAWFWSPALFIKCKGDEQHDKLLSGDRAWLEPLPKAQAGSKPVAPGWKRPFRQHHGSLFKQVTLQREAPAPITNCWLAGRFVFMSSQGAHSGARRKYGGNLLRPCSFSIKWIEKKTMKRLCENYRPLSQ